MGHRFSRTRDPPLELSDAAIRQYVDRLLADPAINSMVPDSIERRIYIRFIHLLLALIKQTLESTRIEFLNHVITFRIEPLGPEDPLGDDTTSPPPPHTI